MGTIICMGKQEQKEQQEMRLEQPALYESLVAYGQSDFYPYHMPGHKRNRHMGELSDTFQIDITEIDGFDNLHQAQGILKRAMERAAALYGSEEAFFLVNGSTCGILSAICAATDKGDTILIARNCHKSVYHAAFLQELRLQYLYPGEITEYGIADAICPADVEAALIQYPECKAVVITSPTYEGIITDIGKISKIVHEKKKILIVDEAHGAHLGLAKDVHENAVRQGADLVIHSLHKTLPSMTQTALLHVNGSYVNRAKLRRYVSIYQSSSPSYVLMASMDACISYMQEKAHVCFKRMEQYRKHFMEQMEQCKYIHIGNPEILPEGKYYFTAWDICKIVIFIKPVNEWRMSGQELYDILRGQFHLQPEMATGNYVLAIMTIADEEEGWQRLAAALACIDDKIEMEAGNKAGSKKKENRDRDKNGKRKEEGTRCSRNELTIAEALHRADCDMPRKVLFTHAAGEIAGDFINLYPPGIPLVVPGEVIDEGIIDQIQGCLRAGLPVQGVSEDGYVIVC